MTRELLQHHIKYKEIDGYDLIEMLTPSQHTKLHSDRIKSGHNKIPKYIIQRAHKRSPLGRLHTRVNASVYREKNVERMSFGTVVEPFTELYEQIVYNKKTGNITYVSYFHGTCGIKLPVITF